MALVACQCIWQWRTYGTHRVLVVDPFCTYHQTHPPKES